MFLRASTERRSGEKNEDQAFHGWFSWVDGGLRRTNLAGNRKDPERFALGRMRVFGKLAVAPRSRTIEPHQPYGASLGIVSRRTMPCSFHGRRQQRARSGDQRDRRRWGFHVRLADGED